MTEEITWHLEKRNIKDLVPYFKNPRRLTKHQEKHLRTSLKKFGLVDRPSINLDNTIIGGHQRINVLGKKLKEIDVMVPSRELTFEEVEELNIRFNKNSGEFDFDVLGNEYDVEKLIAYGFTEEELAYDVDSATGFSTDDEEEENVNTCPNCGQKIGRK